MHISFQGTVSHYKGQLCVIPLPNSWRGQGREEFIPGLKRPHRHLALHIAKVWINAITYGVLKQKKRLVYFSRDGLAQVLF